MLLRVEDDVRMPQSTKSHSNLRTAMSVISDANCWVAWRLLLSFYRNDASRITHIFREVC
jgi:hypothetical protein